jgi:kumamolisin
MPKFNQFTMLAGSMRANLFGEDAGVPDPDQEIEVILHLRRKRALNVPELVARRKFLSRGDLENHYGAAVEDVGLVLAFAYHFGLQTVVLSSGKRIVVLRGSARAICAAFQVQLLMRNFNGKLLRGHLGHVFLPNELDGVVTGVFGLDHRPQARPHFRVCDIHLSNILKPNGFDGNQLASVYDFPSSDGKGEKIALIELGGGYVDADIKAFFASLNLPTPAVSSVSVDGASNTPLLDPGADTEVALDIEVAGAAAPSSAIVVYFAPNTDAGFLQAILAAVHDPVNKPSIMSISWGGAESTWTAQQMTAMDEVFQSAAAVGISVFSAAGDDGANDNVNDGKAHVDFPSSSPFVTACGGTTLVLSNGARQESVWNDGDGSATGGGISDFFPIPQYQKQIVMPVSLATNFAGRGLPDVSAVGDPSTGYAVLVDGLWQIVGGTSAVAPLFAGLMARINSLTGNAHGSINPALYEANSSNGFNDITQGNNSVDGIIGYNATTGWDPVSGWGSPGGSSLLKLLQANA